MKKVKTVFTVTGKFLSLESDFGMDSFNLNTLKSLSKRFNEDSTCNLRLKFDDLEVNLKLSGVDEDEEDIELFQDGVNYFINNIFEQDHESYEFYLIDENQDEKSD